MQISDQGSKQKTFTFLPKWIAAAAFSLRVGHQGRDQFQNVLFTVNITERIIVHRLFEVDSVQDFYLVAILQHGLPTFENYRSFRVSDHIGAVALQEIRFQPKPGLSAAGAAHHQHVFIPGILGVRRTVGHHQPFRFGQDDVVGKLGSHERLNVLGGAP